MILATPAAGSALAIPTPRQAARYLRARASRLIRRLDARQRRLVGFAASAFATWLVDYVLVLALSAVATTLVAVVAARIVSCCLCFVINRRVFDATAAPLVPAASRYALPSAFVLAGSYGGISLLATAGLSLAVAKVLTDSALYVVDYLAQRLAVHTVTP